MVVLLQRQLIVFKGNLKKNPLEVVAVLETDETLSNTSSAAAWSLRLVGYTHTRTHTETSEDTSGMLGIIQAAAA